MLEAFMWGAGIPAWTIGGAYAAKGAIALAEKHYIDLSRQAWERDRTLVPQEKMDADDWVGASFLATLAFAAAPLLGVLWLGKQAFRPFKKPTVAFFEPPLQKQWNGHVDSMNRQKEILMTMATTYKEVCSWEPEDHPDRVKMKQNLEDQIKEQMAVLMKMSDPKRAWDGNYLADVKDEVRALTAGGR